MTMNARAAPRQLVDNLLASLLVFKKVVDGYRSIVNATAHYLSLSSLLEVRPRLCSELKTAELDVAAAVSSQ